MKYGFIYRFVENTVNCFCGKGISAFKNKKKEKKIEKWRCNGSLIQYKTQLRQYSKLINAHTGMYKSWCRLVLNFIFKADQIHGGGFFCFVCDFSKTEVIAPTEYAIPSVLKLSYCYSIG